MSKINEMRLGFETAYIDASVVSSSTYRPQFVSNNHKEGKKVLSSIEDELLLCDGFQISVAFITMSGITPLLQTLKELEKRNIKGEILTTNYLNFSEPRALKKLDELSNITLKMYDVEIAAEGFHTKGYIFKTDEIYRIIIGSSNITSAALTSNREWNTRLISTEQGEVAKEIVAEFNELWNSKYALSFDDFYENYKERYKIIKHQREIAKQEEITSIEKYKLQPNSMQVGFITNLKKILAAGEDRALLISATGTGKTYASAFAMRELRFIQLSTTEFDSVTTEEEEFEYDSKIIKVKFGSSRVIRHGLTDTPIKINSLLGFEFEATDDYVFVYQLWRVAKQFVQYLCYRENVFFSNVELLAHYEKGKYIGAGELYVLSDLERCDVEEEILKRGYYIRQKDIEGAVGAILQSIADNTIYLRHLPKSHEDGCHMDAARFIMLTAAFEWEFRRIFPNGIKKSEKEINAEETVIQLLDSMIEDNTGKTKKILRHLKKNVRNNSLSRKLNFVGLELGNIINVFGEYLYKLNGEKLKYSELGERLSGQRNNYAHGNLDKDFDALSLLDLIYLERIIYAMQLKFYGIEDLKIKKAINNLFQAHIRIEE